MPILFRCPNGHQLRAQDDEVGKQAKCPRCQALVEVPQFGIQQEPESGAEGEDELAEAISRDRPLRQALPDDGSAADDEPPKRKKSRRGRRPRERRFRFSIRGLNTANLGIGLHYARIIVLLACVGIISALLVFPLIARAWGLLIALVVGIVFVGPALGTTGSILCLWVPEQSNARRFIIAALVLDLATILIDVLVGILLLSIFSGALTPAARGQEDLLLLGCLAVVLIMGGLTMLFLMGFIAWALFMMFLRSLCVYLGQNPMAEEATAIVTRGILILVLALVALSVLMFLLRLFPCGVVPALIVFLFSLYHYFVFLRRQLDLILSLRHLIVSRF